MRFKNRLGWRGKFIVEIHRANGTVEKHEFKNGMTNVGKNTILDVAFRQQANQTWYIGLIDTGAVLNAADTMASHAGWTEATYYTAGTRIAWGPSAAASQSITSTAQASFTINAGPNTLYGIFIASDSTKGGSSGILWSTGAFGTAPTVSNTDVIKVTYTVNA